jgi:hypothetical protein
MPVVFPVMIPAMPFPMFRMIPDLPVFGFVAVTDHGLVMMLPVLRILPDVFIVVHIRMRFVKDHLITMIEVGIMETGRQAGGEYAAAAFPVDIPVAGDIVINIVLRNVIVFGMIIPCGAPDRLAADIHSQTDPYLRRGVLGKESSGYQ